MFGYRTLLAAIAVGLLALVASPARGSASEETHCVVHVVGQASSGELIVFQPTCYDTLADAMSVASGGQVTASMVPTGEELVADPASGSMLSTFTLGIHFDGANGSGSSISVVGSSCVGGYWNMGATWANRISSSWNGCYRLRHHDSPNKVGTYADTVGSGTHNLPSFMDNRTESVSYWGS